jgi:hypothetical protein
MYGFFLFFLLRFEYCVSGFETHAYYTITTPIDRRGGGGSAAHGRNKIDEV